MYTYVLFIKTSGKDVVFLQIQSPESGKSAAEKNKAWLRDSIISAAAAGSLTKGCGDYLVCYTALLLTPCVILSAQPTAVPEFWLVTLTPLNGRRKEKAGDLYQLG